MKTLERGFKAWAERTSDLIRKELGIRSDEAMDLTRLAEYLNVQLSEPRNIPGISNDDLSILLVESSDEWYGVGLQSGEKGIVIYNPQQSKRRQASDIAHELAHFLLEHEPARLILSESEDLEQVWLRSYDQKQEDEANCLAWAILVPREGLAALVRGRRSHTEIAEIFGVSEQLITFRINSTGICKQFRPRSGKMPKI